MSKKLYVGGLNWETTEAELKQVFSEFGDVSEVKIITDRDTGRPRGFGFVTFADPESANRAIEKMNGAELGGRTLTVDRAKERAPRGGGGGGGGRGGRRW